MSKLFLCLLCGLFLVARMFAAPVLTINELNANYTTTKVFVDEIAGDSIPLQISFQPNEANITDAEIYTNVNRRDRASLDADDDGYADGISGIDGALLVAGNDDHYYKAYTMDTAGDGAFTLTLSAEKTGAYRLTARWKVQGDPNWRWYSNASANRRDHAITISPTDARDIILYEINVLNIEASGDTFATRSTIEDMHNASGAPHNATNRWDLDYVKGLGANWLWFQPIHPNGYDGREPTGGYDSGTPLYDPGSPYAVKNFFEVNPIMSKDFIGDPINPADTMNQGNRDLAMNAWRNFVADADVKQVGIMLDAPFNHTSFDVEFGQIGIDLFQPDDAEWFATDEIRNREARFFSRADAYDQRAFSAESIAAGPDRYDFGKWRDVKDVYFGNYSALVPNAGDAGRYTSEADQFFTWDSNWNAIDYTQNGVGVNITRKVWEYFANYALHWLEQTRPAGENRNSSTEPGLSISQRYAWDARGIDGLRCDFGQGLPPRAWEYMINVAREVKWNFVMMSESLDGGAVTYRSNRHFDILNENIVFPLASASNKFDYRNIYENRRNAYGQGLILANTTSHDEENYEDPWRALVRYGVTSSLDGVPMIFPGQELGISRTFGYDRYETNFGKQIAHFKRYNSMMPIWSNTDFGNKQLYPVYAGMGSARSASPALRASNRWFIDGDGNNNQIHAVAKYEEANASPAFRDVVIALANLDRDNNQSDNFKIPETLAGLLGLKDDRTYNTKNIAAYENPAIGMTGRRDVFLWGAGFTGSQLKSSGFFASLNRVPVTGSSNSDPGAWESAPFEAQYLRVFDVTPPPSPAPLTANYQTGTTGTFIWVPNAGPDDNVGSYLVEVRDQSDTIVAQGEVSDGSNQFSFTGIFGSIYSAEIIAKSAAGIESTAPASSDAGEPNRDSATTPFILLDPAGDEDGDGYNNANEETAGTDPFDASSSFRILNLTKTGAEVILTSNSTIGRSYRLQTSNSLKAEEWTDLGDPVEGTGATLSFAHNVGVTQTRRFYRVRVSNLQSAQ